jgi:cell wall-associated NlpC family hydrolase
VLLVLGMAMFWIVGIVLWWRRKLVTTSFVAAAFASGVFISLPGRPVPVNSLAADYCRGLRLFRGVSYVWGGEGLLGIDCSGLVRQGLICGQINQGLRALNGRPIRNALWLWWNDCSAQALRDGYKVLTRECFRAEGILEVNERRLQTGDLAVTADGVHVLAYLGNHTWIEADPDAHKVLEVRLPTTNTWFTVPVVFVRWKWLDDESLRQ